jgi:hypothetical protein
VTSDETLTAKPVEPDDMFGSDGFVTLTLLIVDGALIAAFGLVFTPLYWGSVPLPMGALLSMLILPWLILSAGRIDSRPSVAGGPLWAWVLVIGVLGFVGPGGDVLLPQTWQSLLLITGSLVTAVWALSKVLLAEFGRSHG